MLGINFKRGRAGSTLDAAIGEHIAKVNEVPAHGNAQDASGNTAFIGASGLGREHVEELDLSWVLLEESP